jgi:phytoene synthase
MADPSNALDTKDLGPNALDEGLRRTDPDRWLSTRFIADGVKRADVVALYALDHELSQIGTVMREPLMAEIRLTWWREAIEELFAGQAPRGHPVLQALGQALGRRSLAPAPFEAMIQARVDALDAPQFAGAEALENHIDATSGAVMALAVAVLGARDALDLRPAAQAWGLTRLARGDRAALPEGYQIEPAARAALAQARASVAGLPVEAFPAVAHVALARPYLVGRNPLGFEKRLRMTAAVLRGRI